MTVDHQFLWVLLSLDVVLLFMILAGLGKKQLEWKRPGAQGVARRQRHGLSRPAVPPLPQRLREALIAGTAIGGAVALGASLSGVVAPTVLLAYTAAAVFVIVATR